RSDVAGREQVEQQTARDRHTEARVRSWEPWRTPREMLISAAGSSQSSSLSAVPWTSRGYGVRPACAIQTATGSASSTRGENRLNPPWRLAGMTPGIHERAGFDRVQLTDLC